MILILRRHPWNTAAADRQDLETRKPPFTGIYARGRKANTWRLTHLQFENATLTWMDPGQPAG